MYKDISRNHKFSLWAIWFDMNVIEVWLDLLTSVSRFGGLAFDPDTSDPMAMKSTVWFNNKGRHALPSFYNALSNSMLRAALSEAGVSDPENFGKLSFYFISAVNFRNFENILHMC